MKEKATTRHEPYDVEIESALLGSLLVNNRLIDVAAVEMDAEILYDPLHQRLFSTVVRLMADGAVTPLVLHSVMKTDLGLIDLGGMTYLVNLVQAAPALPDIPRYAQILRDLAARRTMMRIADDMVAAAQTPVSEGTALQIADQATEALLHIGVANSKGRTGPLSEVAAARLEAAEKRLGGASAPFIDLGVGKLTKAIGGAQPGDHIVCAARSGMGKTALAGVAARAAGQAFHPVLIISADMTRERWSDRTLVEIDAILHPHEHRIPYAAFRRGLTASQIGRLALAQQALAQWPIEICDEGQISTSRIRSKARAMAKRFPGRQGLLVTDFLQKVQPESSKKDQRRDEDITSTTYQIGDIVKDLGWSALSLAQMKNKAVDTKGKLIEEPPNTADIRESGGIEQAADILFAIHRHAFFLERREPPGRDYAEGPPADWLDWDAEYRGCRNQARLIGFKNRDDSISKLNLDLWCDMASNVILDEAPGGRFARSQSAEDPIDTSRSADVAALLI